MALVGSIHQPNFIPWLGYFAKIYLSDVFILLDTAQYSKNSFINRNKIRVEHRSQWLTLPISYKGQSKMPIRDMKLSVENFRAEKIVKYLNTNYASAPFFKKLGPPIRYELYHAEEHRSLFKLNQAIIKYICNLLELNCIITTASSFSIDAVSSSKMLCELCQANNINKYLCGPSSEKYLQSEPFDKAHINIIRLKRSHMAIPNGELSIVHHLFTSGPDAVKRFLKYFYGDWRTI